MQSTPPVPHFVQSKAPAAVRAAVPPAELAPSERHAVLVPTPLLVALGLPISPQVLATVCARIAVADLLERQPVPQGRITTSLGGQDPRLRAAARRCRSALRGVPRDVCGRSRSGLDSRRGDGVRCRRDTNLRGAGAELCQLQAFRAVIIDDAVHAQNRRRQRRRRLDGVSAGIYRLKRCAASQSSGLALLRLRRVCCTIGTS
mmetsp:Transcript_89342/g.257705  ORF Transcript_89342/g.257705 Transcript_89342/m.257705 type:complete len:203 (-) Transcript_89342:500-1108(-)